MDKVGRSREHSGRAGSRVLDAAEGVLIALRGYRLVDAFAEIADTAKTNNVSALSLADALVGLAQGQQIGDEQDAASRVAYASWGNLFASSHPARGMRIDGHGDGSSV